MKLEKRGTKVPRFFLLFSEFAEPSFGRHAGKAHFGVGLGARTCIFCCESAPSYENRTALLKVKEVLEAGLLRAAAEVKGRKAEIGSDAYAEFTRRFREVRELINCNWNALHLEAGDRGLFED